MSFFSAYLEIFYMKKFIWLKLSIELNHSISIYLIFNAFSTNFARLIGGRWFLHDNFFNFCSSFKFREDNDSVDDNSYTRQHFNAIAVFWVKKCTFIISINLPFYRTVSLMSYTNIILNLRNLFRKNGLYILKMKIFACSLNM